MRPIFALVLLAACTTSQPSAPATLQRDAYYVQGTAPCGAPEPQDCVFELGFCTDGSYGFLMGDVMNPGTYQLENGLAVDETSGFEFDFTTQIMVGNDGIHVDNAPWVVATVDQASSVACADSL